jgi:beta-N-acetylhexosaminidase
MLPAILGLSGQTLSDAERAFFRDADPAGYVLFRRNVADKAQLRALTDALREISGRADLPILIDQEGGRISRLRPPHWPEFPAAARFDALYEKAPISAIEAARVNAQAIAVLLAEVGINVNCLPLLDVRREDADAIIGDRALGGEPMRVAALGRAILEGLEAGGVSGVVKHMPGHGRAGVDSHKALPLVDASEEALESDLAPFRALSDAAIGMTAHVLYPAWDSERCATLSPFVIGQIIRGRIGFQGLLMSDDIAMEALTGDHGARAAAAISAGCDLVLHCSGRLEEGMAIANALGTIGEAALMRLEKAMGRIAGKGSPAGHDALAAKRDALLAFA